MRISDWIFSVSWLKSSTQACVKLFKSIRFNLVQSLRLTDFSNRQKRGVVFWDHHSFCYIKVHFNGFYIAVVIINVLCCFLHRTHPQWCWLGSKQLAKLYIQSTVKILMNFILLQIGPSCQYWKFLHYPAFEVSFFIFWWTKQCKIRVPVNFNF